MLKLCWKSAHVCVPCLLQSSIISYALTCALIVLKTFYISYPFFHSTTTRNLITTLVKSFWSLVLHDITVESRMDNELMEFGILDFCSKCVRMYLFEWQVLFWLGIHTLHLRVSLWDLLSHESCMELRLWLLYFFGTIYVRDSLRILFGRLVAYFLLPKL